MRPVSLSAGLILGACLLAAAGAQTDWPGGVSTPPLSDLGISDPHNTPIATPPGHTDEEPLCPPEVNENLENQLDLTETFVAFDAQDRMYIRSYYNLNSAASTTRQYWFLDIDRNPLTGGHDGVLPDYKNTGQVQGPQSCSTPACSAGALSPVVHASGYEYYIMSYGQQVGDYAVFRWSNALSFWELLPQPAGARALQGADDNPYNPYTGNNGYRGLAEFPGSVVGLDGQSLFNMYTRSWSCGSCCGDDNGGEFVHTPPGVSDCVTVLCGDCDSSGDVTILDVLKAGMASAGVATLSPAEFSNCNVAGLPEPNWGVDVGIMDALIIARYIVGLETLICCAP